jgi:hypothetical protein
LKVELGNKLNLFNLLDDSRGWITNALDVLEHAKYDYVLVWLEDHLNIASPETIKSVANEMKEANADYLTYSWWIFGKSHPLILAKHLRQDWTIGTYIDSTFMTKKMWKEIRNTGYSYYLTSMCGIFRKSFLTNMWKKDNKKRLPLLFKKFIFKVFGLLTRLKIISPYGHKLLFERINHLLFFNEIRKYPKETPFEMEKGPERFDMLPFHIAFPKEELFVCIDDSVNEPGYSLKERGLYKGGKYIG